MLANALHTWARPSLHAYCPSPTTHWSLPLAHLTHCALPIAYIPGSFAHLTYPSHIVHCLRYAQNDLCKIDLSLMGKRQWTIGNLLPKGIQIGFRVNLDLIHLSCIQIPKSPLHDLLRNDLRWSLQKAAQWPFGQGQGGLTSHLQWRWLLIGSGWC